ncbi:MAG: NAD(+)/NADH kinase, partial [Bdellovibrionales bacterium]|nr:NAD(+)/NADH kinase [Bdellovibrionales bacterium]
MQQQISLVFNPISSSGTTAETAQNLSGFLENQGYKTFVVESKQKMSHYQEILHEFEQSSCVLVIGGDGTLRKLLKVLAKSQAPVYMIPGGNESLFAKHFGMTANKELLLSALQRNEILEQYFGVLSGSNFNGEKPFFI